MKVLVLSQHFWPEAFRINDVARALHTAGHEVHVLTGQPNYPEGHVFPGYRAAACGDEDWAGIPIHRVPLAPRGRSGALRLVLNYLSFVASSATFGLWRLRGFKPDAVFVYATSPILQSIGAWVVARAKGAALVTWVQDLWPQSLAVTGYVRHPRALAAVARVVRWIYARHDLLVVPSRAFEPEVRRLAPARVPIEHLPNAGDALADAAPIANPEDSALALDPAHFNIVFAGNFGQAQALDTLLEAAALLRDEASAIRFVLVGSGQRSSELAALVVERGLANVRLPGRFEPAQMPAIYAQAQALVVTLRRDAAMALTVPSKVQSYLAAGRPILAALDGEGARIVVEAGAGLVSPAEDAAALAAAAQRLAALSAAERERMGRAGRAYHDAHFTLERLTPRLADLLAGAVQRLRRQ